MLSQGFAKLASNFGPIWFRPGGDISVWDGIIMIVAAFAFMALALALLKWWFE